MTKTKAPTVLTSKLSLQWTERGVPEELRNKSVADVVDLLEAGKIGHRAAMRYFDLGEDHDALVELMHFNGRKMPGHVERAVSLETQAVLRRAFGLDIVAE